MGYDPKKGHWDYGEELEQRALRPNWAQRMSASLVGAGAGVARFVRALILLALLVAAIVGLVWGSWYVFGRAVGAGLRDSTQAAPR